MNLSNLSKLGLVAIVAALLVAAVGCSNSNPVSNSNNSIDNTESPSLAVTSDKSFSTKGIVQKFDIDQRVIQFEGAQFSTTPNQVTVGREAQMVLRAGAEPIPFDFKFVEVGTALAVTGERTATARIGDLFYLHPEVGEIDVNEPSLDAGDEAATERRYVGRIAKLDIDSRVLQFAGSDFATTSLTFYIDREAMVMLANNAQPVPFDFKYVNIGDYVVLHGTPRAGGGANIDLVELNDQIDDLSSNDQPSFSMGADDTETGFHLKGVVDKFDIDQRVIQFEGTNFGTHPTSFTVDREATMQLLPNDVMIPFDFKFIQVGTALVVEGDLRADGKRVATLVQVQPDSVPFVSASN